MSLYDYTATALDGSEVKLSDYAGKVVSRFESTVDMADVKAAIEAQL